MRTRLLGWPERLRSSYWFVPGVMALAALALSVATLTLDRSGSMQRIPGLSSLGGINQPDGARALLSTVAGSLITVAGVVFSMTLVGLSLASQQFGPRLVGNFMRDRGNQLVLGAFVATFLYCLMVLRTVRSTDATLGVAAFVPHLSVAVALLMTLLSLGVLIYFIHHSAESVQVSYVLARVGRELTEQILSLPEAPASTRPDGRSANAGKSPTGEEERPTEPAEARLPESFDSEAITVRAGRTGYVQAIDTSGLIALAREHDAVLRLHHPPGGFLMLDGPLADVHPPEAADDVAGRIEAGYALGAVRTPHQDVGFLFDQLLEVALRALSPGTNDPFTAMTCVDRLAEAVNLLAHRRMPSGTITDDDGVVRLIVPRTDLPELIAHLFGELRSYGAGDPMVARHLAQTLRRIQASTADPSVREAADLEVRRLLESAVEILSASDYETLRRASRRVTAWIRLED